MQNSTVQQSTENEFSSVSPGQLKLQDSTVIDSVISWVLHWSVGNKSTAI